MVAVGIGAESSRAVSRNLRNTHAQISAAVGIQPNYCAEAVEGDWDRIVSISRASREWLRSEKQVSIDTGIFLHFLFSRITLIAILRLAAETGLPFIVHTREQRCKTYFKCCARRVAESPLQGVMHSFTGKREKRPRSVWNLGLSISFAGMVTFKKADDLRAVARKIPPEHRLLIETDSPYLAPHPLRSHRNEPAYLVHTAECLAAERGVHF